MTVKYMKVALNFLTYVATNKECTIEKIPKQDLWLKDGQR